MFSYFGPVAVILFLVIFIVFRNDFIRPSDKEKPFYIRHKNWIIALTITFIPILLLNFFYPFRYLDEGEELLEVGTKKYDERLRLEGLKMLAREHNDSIPLQLDYIDHVVKYGDKFEKAKIDQTFKLDTKWREDVLNQYTRYYIHYFEYDISETSFLGDSTPYINYVRGQYYLNAAKYSEACYFFEKEIKITPWHNRSFNHLFRLYHTKYPYKIHDLMLNEDAQPHLSFQAKNDYFFYYGYFGRYFSNLLHNSLVQTSFLAYLSSAVLAFVWIFFLYKIDIFSKRPIRDFVIVFLSGAVFTFLCHPIYDWAQIILGMGTNGFFVNDLKYCIHVIGGSEEFVKLLGWLTFILLLRKGKNPMDYIIYAGVSATGFAFIENLMYLESDVNILSRSMTSSSMHIAAGCIVAYGFILMKFKYQNKPWRFILPVLSFCLGAILHGVYDVFLVSNYFLEYRNLFYIPFFIGLFVLFVIINISLNNDSKFDSRKKFNPQYISYTISFLILAVLIFQYVIIAFRGGAVNANYATLHGVLKMGVFLVIISVFIYQIELIKGRWRGIVPQLKFTGFKSPRSIFGMGYEEEKRIIIQDDLSGIKLRLFASKENKYVGTQLPISGYCVKKIQVETDPNWYVFKTNSPLFINGEEHLYFIIKPKEKNQTLTDDKISVYFMVIKNRGKLLQGAIFMKELWYTGNVFSRPIIE
ncbi:MAG: PrsW family intramembrane metalloprotease [Crocinitomicaceae bacterium]|nr:PrsW family intramembrane metalloprotease [Crocinitomicaceae bacterium]